MIDPFAPDPVSPFLALDVGEVVFLKWEHTDWHMGQVQAGNRIVTPCGMIFVCGINYESLPEEVHTTMPRGATCCRGCMNEQKKRLGRTVVKGNAKVTKKRVKKIAAGQEQLVVEGDETYSL